MESVLKNVERGICNAQQHLIDTRARLATHRATLDGNRRALVRAMSSLLLLHPDEVVSPMPSTSLYGASDTLLTPLRSGPSASTSAAAGSSPSPDALFSVDDFADDVEATIIINPAALSLATASAAAAARAGAPPAPPLLQLQPPPLVSSVPAFPATWTSAGFYAAVAARTQQLEAERFRYRHEHGMRTAKLWMAHAWVREVLPWFEAVAHRSFFTNVVQRLDALDRRVARLCRRIDLDRPQYTPTCCRTMQLQRGTETPDELAGKARHLPCHQLRARWCPCLTETVCQRMPVDEGPGTGEEARTGGDDGGEREAVQPQSCGCTEALTRFSVPPSQQRSAGDATRAFGSVGGSHHSVCPLWCQYDRVISQTDTSGDEQLRACEPGLPTPLPATGLPVPLLRTPRSLRHVWHVIMEGLTSSDVVAGSGAVAAEPVTAPPATDGDAAGAMVRQLGHGSYQLGHSDALMQNLSSLVRQCFELRSSSPRPQPRLPPCNNPEHHYETGCCGGRGGAAGDGRRDAIPLVQVRLPSGASPPTEDVFHSHTCALLCCAMQLCTLAEPCHPMHAAQLLHDGAALPQLVYDEGTGARAEDDTAEGDCVGRTEMEPGGSRKPIAVLAETTGDHFMGQRTPEQRIVEALAAVYHAVPRLLSHLQLVLQTQSGRREDGSGAWQGRRGETEAIQVDASARPRPCAISAEMDCTCVTNSAVDAARYSTVGDAARDGDAFAQRWLSLSPPSITTAASPPDASLMADVPFVYARALRVGSMFRFFVDAVEDECGERLHPPPGGAAAALPSPALPSPHTTMHADASTMAIGHLHLAQLSTAAAHRVNAIAPKALPPLSASARLSSLRQTDLQARQQWQSIETRLSVARSMAAAALRRAALGDSEAHGLPG
ncbi:hypothetical protein LSCM1_04218 [Leishmania martiniquensis]|uniref:Uncharacterized protein n=1 Tax=Leishmania martiniquensis TaxID=1580590 RepID=A0A836H2R9_9TRYP|nr:hypothetical protein LSCM1_04218 [Leishmania martiniquensis]